MVSDYRTSQLGTVIIVVSLLLNVPVNYVLMFGSLGFPALGLAGIGWGTTLIYWVSLLAAVSMIYFHPKSRDYKLFRYLDEYDLELFGKIFKTGWPAGIRLGMQLGLFTATAWLMGNLGTASLAGHEIAIETSDMFLAIPFAISYTATARVGQMMGEKNPEGAMRATLVNLGASQSCKLPTGWKPGAIAFKACLRRLNLVLVKRTTLRER